jgi:hypothetical protein
LLVRLFKDSTGVRFERDLLAADPRLKGRTAAGDDWVLSLPFYLARTTTQEKQVLATATLETPKGRDPGRDGNLQQTRPGFVWWDIAPETGPRAKTVRVTNRPQLPAPAWNMLAEGWPGTTGRYTPAVVRAWADFAAPPAAYKVSIETARLASGEVAVEATGEDGKVQVFAALEDWPLRVDTEERNDFATTPPPRVPCLVIRVLHPDKKPVFVRPSGVTFGASEQRFYPPSAAVTAAFPVSSKDDLEAQLQGRPLELELVSIERFKAEHKPVVLNMGPAGQQEQPLVASPVLGEKTDKAP